MAASNSSFHPGNRRSRSAVPCYHDRRCSLSGADAATSHRQPLHHTYPVSSRLRVCCSRVDVARTGVSGRAGEKVIPTAQTPQDRLAMVPAQAAPAAPATLEATGTTRSRVAAVAATAALSAAPSTPTASLHGRNPCVLTGANPSRASLGQQRGAARASSGIYGKTADPTPNNSHHTYNREEPGTPVCRREDPQSIRQLKKLHVLPAGPRAENWQVLRVLKMYMREEKVITSCMSFQVPLEPASTTFNSPSGETPACEADEAARVAMSDSGASKSSGVSSPRCQRNLFSCSFSSSTPVPSSCPAGTPSSIHHCEFSPSSSGCMSSATVSTVSYTAVRSHSPHYQTAPIFSSSVCESSCDSVTASGYSPKRFLSSKASLSQLRCPSTACCPSSSSASSFSRTPSPSFDSASRSTTYVVVDCSPASGLLTADTLVYLSGAPLQRLRRVQLMALVHPNSAYGRRAGICSYQQVFERRPDFPYLEQEEYQLLREAPAHFRDFARTLQISTEAAACVGEADAETAGGAAASDTTEENSIHAFDAEKRYTSPSLRSSASSGTAVGGVAEIGEPSSTYMGETDGDSTHTSYMDTREEALSSEEIDVKKMLVRRGVASAERQDSDQSRREKTQVLFHARKPRETDTGLPDLNRLLDAAEDGGAGRVPGVNPLYVGKESIKQHRKAAGAACNPHLCDASADSLAATPPVASRSLVNGGRATALAAVPSAAFSSADILAKSKTSFHEKDHSDDAHSRRPSFWLKRSVLGARIDMVDACHPYCALTASYNSNKGSGAFRSRSLETFCYDPNSNGYVRRNNVISGIRSDHENRRSTRRVKSSCCFGSTKSTSHFLVEANASYGWDASTASRSSSSSSSRSRKSRSRRHFAIVSTVEMPFPSGASRGSSSVQNFSTSSGSAFDIICSTRTDEGPFIRRKSGAASLTHSHFLARREDVTGDCREVAELPDVADESHSAPTGRLAPEAKRSSSIRENEDMLPYRRHGSGDLWAQQQTIRRVSHAQQQQRITHRQRGRRMLHVGRQRGDRQEEVASSSSHSSADAQLTAVGRDKFCAIIDTEKKTSVKDIGSLCAARPEPEAEALRDPAAAESGTSGGLAEPRGRARQMAQRTRENEKAKSGGRADKRRGKAADAGERSADRHLPEADTLSARDAAPLRGGNEGKETARNAVTGSLIAAEMAVSAGIAKTAGKTTIGRASATGVKRGSVHSLGERDGRVRSTTHDHEQMQLQRLDADTLFRFFLGPYLLRKLGTRNGVSTGSEKRAEITGNGEEETACGSNGRIAESPAFRCRGRRRGEVSGKKEEDPQTPRQDLKRGDSDARRTSEIEKKQKSTLVLYPGKELVIKDITFVVWAADPAGVPGLLDEDTVIYICLDPYGEYRRVHFIPFSDTLPTTYTFDFYEDYLKPFLLENKWRNFRRGDVFSYRGVEFKLIATDPSSTVGARVGPATVVYHEGTMQPTVMDVLPGDVLHHIRRLPARMQPAAIIFAAQRLDPEVLMRVMPSNSANRSRRGLDEHTAEMLRERLVRPFSFAAYLEKNASLCCHLSPTVERPSAETRTTGVRARMTCSDRHPITCWTVSCASSPSAPGIMRHDPTGQQRSSEISGCRARWDVTRQKGDEGTVSVGVTSAPAGNSLENAHGGTQATDCVVQVASCHMAHGRAYGSPTDGACGESLFHHTQHASPSEEAEHSMSQHNREEDMSNRDRPSCTVCTLPMEERDASILLYCGHVFHWQCIHLWFRHNSTCPNCRAEIAELLRQQEDSLRRRGTDPNVQTLEQGESGGGGGDGTEEDGALWLLNTVRRVVSSALFGMQL